MYIINIQIKIRYHNFCIICGCAMFCFNMRYIQQVNNLRMPISILYKGIIDHSNTIKVSKKKIMFVINLVTDRLNH